MKGNYTRLAAEILLTSIGVAVSVVYSGEHLSNLGEIHALGTALPVGYIIAAMIAVMVFGLFKGAVNPNIARRTRIQTFITGVLIAAISVNTAYQNMRSNDIKSVKLYNENAKKEADRAYQQAENERMAQHRAKHETGKASVFKADTKSLDQSIKALEAQVKEAQQNYITWNKKLMVGNKQSNETKVAAQKAEKMYNSLREDLNKLMDRKKQSTTGLVTTTKQYVAEPKPPVKYKSEDPFILTYAITIDAYLLFIAFLFRPTNKSHESYLETLKQKIASLQQELPLLQRTNRSLQNDIKTTKGELDKRTGERDKQQQHNLALSNTNQKLKVELDDASQKQEQLRHQQSEMQQNIERLHDEKQQLIDAKNATKARLQKTQNAIKKMAEKLETETRISEKQNAKIRDLENSKNAISATLEDIQKRLNSKREKLESETRKNAELKRQNQQLNTEITAIKQQLSETAAHLEKQQNSAEEKTRISQNQNAQIRDLENSKNAISATLKQVEKRLNSNSEKLESETRKNAQQSATIRDLQSSTNSLISQRDQLQNTVDELQQRVKKQQEHVQRYAEHNKHLKQQAALLDDIIKPVVTSVIEGNEEMTKAGNYSKNITAKNHKLDANIVEIAFNRLVEMGIMIKRGEGNNKRWLRNEQNHPAQNDNVLPLRKAS